MANPTLKPVSRSQPIPVLRNGQRLSRDEFERRFDAMPDLKKAELIEGVVYMPSPVRQKQHGGPHFDLIGWMSVFRVHTPGVGGGVSSSIRLDMDNEPQPDGVLFNRAGARRACLNRCRRLYCRLPGVGGGSFRQHDPPRPESQVQGL